MKNKYTKGFSLIELLVSMLVVAIAMLGFAALQAYSSRTIASSFSKNVGSNIILDVSRMFQMGVLDVSELDWNSKNPREIVCLREVESSGQGDTPEKSSLEDINTDKSKALYENISSVCSNIISNKLKGIEKAYLSVRLNREKLSDEAAAALPKYYRYVIDIRFAYQPLVARTSEQDLDDVNEQLLKKFDSSTMDKYCPNKYDDENYKNEEAAKKLRSEANVVCSRVEVNL